MVKVSMNILICKLFLQIKLLKIGTKINLIDIGLPYACEIICCGACMSLTFETKFFHCNMKRIFKTNQHI